MRSVATEKSWRLAKWASADFMPNKPDISAALFSSFIAHYKNKQTVQPLAAATNIWRNIFKRVENEPDNVLDR